MSGLPRVITNVLNKFYGQLNYFNNPEIHFFGYFWGFENDSITAPLRNIFPHKFQAWFHEGSVETIYIRKKAPETKIINVLSMFKSRMKLMEACKDLNVFDDQLYDFYIYTRPDSCLNGNLNLSEVLERLDKFDLLLPKNGHWRNGVNDQFAIGKSAAMKTYLDVYKNLKKYIDDDILFHPETLLKFHLKSNGIKIGYLELDNQLLRTENTFIIDPGKKLWVVSILELSKFICKKLLSTYKHIGEKLLKF